MTLLTLLIKAYLRIFKRSPSDVRLVLFCLVLMQSYSCSTPQSEKLEALAETEEGRLALQMLPENTTNLTGQQLAQAYCVACHSYPDPALLDRVTWQDGVLPDMGERLGIKRAAEEGSFFSDHIKAEEENDTEDALISKADWQKIVDFYVSEAPATALPQQEKLEVKTTLPLFQARVPAFNQSRPPLTTLVRFDENSSMLYLGSRSNLLYTIDNRTLQVLDSIQTGTPPSDIRLRKDGNFHLLTMGVMDPSDKEIGELRKYKHTSLSKPEISIKDLARPVQFAFGDLNQDNEEDVVICHFGKDAGRLAWYEKTGNNYKEHVLRGLPGARRAIIVDLNKDGFKDIVALMTQAQEGVYAYLNDKAGGFNEVLLLRFPPVYGSSDFEIADFNKDGAWDILYTNGDNADMSVTLKNYHGVRIFLNDGQNNFKQGWFYPQHGSSRAVTKDFDQDGDLDIAAISFFPDFEKAPHESFIYFENHGNMKFEPRTFEASPSGRWLTLETGDVDQDGDEDMVLGSFNFSMRSGNYALEQKWASSGVPFLILENKLKK